MWQNIDNFVPFLDCAEFMQHKAWAGTSTTQIMAVTVHLLNTCLPALQMQMLSSGNAAVQVQRAVLNEETAKTC